MALVLDPTWGVQYSFRDNNGKRSALNLNFPSALTLTELLAIIVTGAGHLRSVSDAAIVGVNLSAVYKETDTGLLAAPTTSEVERKLRFNLGTTQRTRAATIEIPSPLFSLEQSGTDIVNQADAGVVALKDWLISGLALPGNGPVSVNGDDLVTISPGEVAHRTRQVNR